jgi:hypothetical protein
VNSGIWKLNTCIPAEYGAKSEYGGIHAVFQVQVVKNYKHKFKGCCPGNFTSELSRHSRNQDRVGGRFLPTKSKTAHCSPQHKLADSHIHVPHWARGSAWRLWRQQRANRCATTNERKTSLARQGRTPRRRRRRPCRLRTRRPMVARTDTHDTLNLENI